MSHKSVAGFANKDKKKLVYLSGTVPVQYEGESCFSTSGLRYLYNQVY